jgi:hypothetical protein
VQRNRAPEKAAFTISIRYFRVDGGGQDPKIGMEEGDRFLFGELSGE